LAAKFPLTRLIVERRNLSARLYEAGDPLCIADALKDIERMTGSPVPLRKKAAATAERREALGFLLDWLLASARAR
jgi:hypothetical protein